MSTGELVRVGAALLLGWLPLILLGWLIYQMRRRIRALHILAWGCLLMAGVTGSWLLRDEVALALLRGRPPIPDLLSFGTQFWFLGLLWPLAWLLALPWMLVGRRSDD